MTDPAWRLFLLRGPLRGIRTGAWLAAVLLIGFARAEQVIDIPVLVAGYGSAFFEETAREFEAQRPGVRVRIYGDPRINDKVRIRVMAGDFPDATDAVLLYPRLIAGGRILDLAPYLDGPNWEGDARWRDTFLPGVLDRWDHQGRIYGLPFAHALWTIFYNRRLFREHGWEEPATWDEFFALCERLQAAGVPPLAMPGVVMRYGDAFLRSAHYNLTGPADYRAYNELAPGARTDPRFIRAAEVVRVLSSRYLLRGWEGLTHTGAQLAFIEGRAAMTISGSWFVNEMRGKIPADFELGTMNFPVFPDGVTPRDTVQTQSAYYFLFATGDPERERITVDFFRFLTSRERARRFVQTIDAPVALRSVQPEDFSPSMRATAELIARSPASFDAQPPASAAFLAMINQALTEARYRLMTGRSTAEEFGQRLEAAASAERARLASPDQVEVRHGWATAGLLLAVGGLAAWAAYPRGRRSRRARPRAPDAAADPTLLGRLRPRLAAGFVGPALVLFLVLVVGPALASFAWALTRWDGFGERTWAGLFNFRWLLLESDVFWFALRNNLFLMLVPAVLVVPTALFFAALLHRGIWGAGVFRAVFLFPNLLGGIAATLLWMHAYDPHGGLVNAAFLKLADGLTALRAPEAWIAWARGFDGYAWLSQTNLYRSLIPIYLWMACGFNLVLYLAAMEGIPRDLYEAAELDGAPAWRQFFTITLPLIWEVLVISAVFLVIYGINAFEMIWLLTSQDPVAGSHTLSTLMVSTMFQEFQIGRATAIAVIMFMLVLVGTAAVRRALRREVVER